MEKKKHGNRKIRKTGTQENKRNRRTKGKRQQKKLGNKEKEGTRGKGGNKS